jgi:MFS family permease
MMDPQHQALVNEKDQSPIDEEDGEANKSFRSSKDSLNTASISVSSHMASTIALCLCTLTNSWLLISVFPYSGFMAVALIPSANEENAGSYAGLLASSFLLGRALSSYGWGKVADSYGRVFVLQASLIMSCVFTLLFGLSQTFLLATCCGDSY